MWDIWDTRTGDLVGSFESLAESNERIRLLTEAESGTERHWFQVSHTASRIQSFQRRARAIRLPEASLRIG